MRKDPPDSQYATSSDLKERGWSLTMIRDFLAPADATRPGRISSKGKVHLYRLDRVEQAEATPEWQRARETSLKRSASASDAAIRSKAARVASKESERARVLQRASEVDLKLKRDLSLAELRELALQSSRCNSPNSSVRSDRQHQERWMVNYIRHELSSYDLELTRLGDGPGHQEARVHLQERLIKLIAEVWPDLERAAIIAAQRAEVRPVHRAAVRP